jgi:hypothetical protein
MDEVILLSTRFMRVCQKIEHLTPVFFAISYSKLRTKYVRKSVVPCRFGPAHLGPPPIPFGPSQFGPFNWARPIWALHLGPSRLRPSCLGPSCLGPWLLVTLPSVSISEHLT